MNTDYIHLFEYLRTKPNLSFLNEGWDYDSGKDIPYSVDTSENEIILTIEGLTQLWNHIFDISDEKKKKKSFHNLAVDAWNVIYKHQNDHRSQVKYRIMMNLWEIHRVKESIRKKYPLLDIIVKQEERIRLLL